MVGAVGGLLAFLVAEPLGGRADIFDLWAVLWSTSLWSGTIGLVLGVILLAYDNANSLRGAWHRDLLPALPLFFLLGMMGGTLASKST